MEINEVWGYLATAIGGGGVTQILNWRINRKKGNSEAKGMEIENIKKVVDEVYQPLINQQNARIKELEAEVKSLRDERTRERDSYQKQIATLQKQIVDITKALGMKASEQLRDEKTGRYLKKESV